MFDETQRGNVCVVSMDHGKANVLDTEFCLSLTARLEELRDSPLHAVVLTGKGGIFSAGVDLLRVLDGGPEYLSRFLPALSNLFETLFAFPKPVIAAINGHAIAGGCVIACAADYRLMAEGAGRIGVPELLVGVPFPTSALEIMRFAVPPQHLQTLIYGGSTYSSSDAAARGLVDAVGEPGKLLDQALAAAEKLAALPPAAFALTKTQLRESALKRIREDGPRVDPRVQEIWSRPESLAAIRDYVSRTFKASAK
jgi:enoyl-CoA hydratase